MDTGAVMLWVAVFGSALIVCLLLGWEGLRRAVKFVYLLLFTTLALVVWEPLKWLGVYACIVVATCWRKSAR